MRVSSSVGADPLPVGQDELNGGGAANGAGPLNGGGPIPPPADPPGLIGGDTAPNFASATLDGEHIRLSDFRGKLVLVVR